jgi:adenylyl-sulfate kinase
MRVELLDGDIVRTSLCRDLGFSKQDREENIRRIGFVAELLARNGVAVIVAAISPFRKGRDEIRSRTATFIEVHVVCSIDVLIARDSKGLYRRALSGELQEFTGISSPYESPLCAEVSVDTSFQTAEVSASRVWSALQQLGLLE